MDSRIPCLSERTTTVRRRSWSRRAPGRCRECGHAIKIGDPSVRELIRDWKGHIVNRRDYHSDCWEEETPMTPETPTATPAPTTAPTPDKAARLVELMKRHVVSCEDDLAKWTQDLLDGMADPLYRFEWASEAVKAAGIVSEYNRWLVYLTREGDPTPAVRYSLAQARLLEDVRHAALYPTTSTSAMVNLAAQAQQAARARLLELMDNVDAWAARA